MAMESVPIAARLIWRRLGMLVLANILWLLMSLPLVTWPASTVGLYTLVRRLVHEELDDATQQTTLADYWDGFTTHWARGSLFTLLDLAAALAIVVALFFYGGGPSEPLRWLIGPIALIGILWLGAQMYAYPLLLHRASTHPISVLREALLMAVGYPLPTLSLLVTSLALLVAAIALAGPVLLIFFSAMAVLQTVALRQLLVARGEIEDKSS